MAGTVWGRPAETHPLRATFVLCSPTWLTQPADDVVDALGVDARPLEQRGQGEAQEVGRVPVGQRAAALAERGAHDVDDDGLSHVSASSMLAPQALSAAYRYAGFGSASASALGLAPTPDAAASSRRAIRDSIAAPAPAGSPS